VLGDFLFQCFQPFVEKDVEKTSSHMKKQLGFSTNVGLLELTSETFLEKMSSSHCWPAQL